MTAIIIIIIIIIYRLTLSAQNALVTIGQFLALLQLPSIRPRFELFARNIKCNVLIGCICWVTDSPEPTLR